MLLSKLKFSKKITKKSLESMDQRWDSPSFKKSLEINDELFQVIFDDEDTEELDNFTKDEDKKLILVITEKRYMKRLNLLQSCAFGYLYVSVKSFFLAMRFPRWLWSPQTSLQSMWKTSCPDASHGFWSSVVKMIWQRFTRRSKHLQIWDN